MKLIEAINKCFIKKTSFYTLKTVDSEEEYNRFMVCAGHSSFMQSWDYGEALKCLGWKVQRYAVFFIDKPVAFFQVISKQLVFECLRIPQGPLFLSSDYEALHALPILQVIRNRWRFWKGKTLLISPFQSYSTRLHSSLTQIGFRLTNTLQWESAVIDLSLDANKLLANMKSRWRTMLNKALRAPLKIISASESDFYWLLEQYEQFKCEKQFNGVKRELLESLYNQMFDKKNMHILLCEYKNNYIAGIIVVSHGSSCSYLLGWSGSLGRKFSAQNLLLWEAIKAAKLRKECFFDLAGTLSSPKYKSITYYKMGLNGKQYRLVGEYY